MTLPRWLSLLLSLSLAFSLWACTAAPPTATLTAVAPTNTAQPTATPPPPSGPTNYTYRILNKYPHDPAAFTQGLIFVDGVLYEGTGLNGQSSLRRVDLATGQVQQIVRLPQEYFGEGITLFDDKIYQLTWQSNTGFIYNATTFEPLGQFSYPTEGWGLTHNGQQLIMSDGTATLYFLDPATLTETRRISVQAEGQAVSQLNELEYINGEVWANIWKTEQVARIDPASGKVLGWVNLSGLLQPQDITQRIDVLNGIAYDAATERLFVTGKWWPLLFEIEVFPAEANRE